MPENTNIFPRINDKFPIYLPGFLVFFISLLITGALSSDDLLKIHSFSQSDSLISNLQENLSQVPADSDKRYQLIQLFMQRGEWEKAELEVSILLREKPADNNLLFLLGQILRRTYRFPAAENIFHRILQQEKNNREAKLALSDLYIIKKNIPAADSLLEELLWTDSLDSQTWSRKAALTYLYSRNEDARSLYRHALQIDPDNSTARSGLARIYFDESVLDSSKKYVQIALDCDFFDAEAHSLLGYIFFREGNIAAAGDEFRLALKCDIFNLSAHRIYGQGLTDQDYSHFQYPDELIKADSISGKILQQAWSAFELSNYDNAKALFWQLTRIDTVGIYGFLGLGSIEWLQGDLDQSFFSFNKILEKYPGYGTAHNGISRVLSAKIDLYAVDFEKSLRMQSQIPFTDYPSLEEVFINFQALPPNLQKAIFLSVSSLAKFLPALDTAGATFYILPLHEKLTDTESRKFLRGVRTFDLRLWDDVRGNGGLHATSCSGSCWDALHFKFNEVTHEFAHQVHIYALTEEEKENIRKLFYQALEHNRCLDVYARSDEFEYFAVGMEAYITREKRLDQKLYHGHTRSELLRKDPLLLDLIEQLIRKENISENILSARIYKAENFIYTGELDEAISASESVLQDQPSFVPAFHTLGRSLLLKGKTDQAIDIFTRAVMIDENNGSNWKLLANAQYVKTGKLKAAKKKILEGSNYDTTSAELNFELATIERLLGNLPAAGSYYSRASRYDPTLYTASSGAAYSLLRQGYHMEAENLLKTILQRKKQLDALMVFGELRLKQEKMTEAEQLFQTAAALDQKNSEIQSFGGLLKCKTGDAAAGIAKQMALVDSNRSNLRILNNLLYSLCLSDGWEEAEKYLPQGEIIIKENRKKEKPSYNEEDLYYLEIPAELISDFYFYQGLIYSKTRQQSAAIKAFQNSIKMLPVNFDSYLEIVQLYSQQGDKKQQDRYLKKMLELNPGPYYQ